LPRFGAEISGVDISRPLDATTAQRLIDLQDEWGVTVYRNTGLDTESHIAFSRLFGHLELAPAIKSPDGQELPRRLPRELFLSSNIGPDGEINRNPSSRLYAKGDRLWHTDSSFMPVRSAYSLLLAHEVPPADGLTWFADTRSAYDDLPQETKERIEDLVVEHSLWWSRRAAGAEISEEEIDARTKARHKMVYTDPRTGRRALYVGAHARDVIGMEREEGRRLIAELNAWIARPEYVFSVAWQVGDMVIWNNLISQHRGGEFDIDNHRREMRRTTVREATPQDAGADPFSALFSEMPQLIKS
ncbi:MAG TPA: TauD/TfdA family dioxygenase, partial [Novosphingobium sp.]|nr:TauD/TfdA family dioxygenase [Novosphingobium sp.]